MHKTDLYLYRIPSAGHGAIAAILVVLAWPVAATPLPLRTPQGRATVVTTPVTTVDWSGHTSALGGYLLSRLNLEFINITCSRFSTDFETARQVLQILIDTKLDGASLDHKKQFIYLIQKMDYDLKYIIQYVTSLLLCSQSDRETLWTQYQEFQAVKGEAWALVKSYNPNSGLIRAIDNTAEPIKNETSILLTYLINASTESHRQAKNPLFLGLGLGFLSSLIFDKLFDNNKAEIATLNANIKKNNKYLAITNERINILEKQVAKTNSNIKNVLLKMIAAQEKDDLMRLITWNLEQVLDSVHEIKILFRFAELTVMLLDEGILNPELIDLHSLQRIVTEGQATFPNLKFPLQVDRHNLAHIVKITKVHKVGHLQYLMILPLIQEQKYKITEIIPHPIRIDKTSNPSLVLPEVDELLLINKKLTYISTKKDDLYPIGNGKYILMHIKPIHSQFYKTCEWVIYQKSIDEILKYCNFKKFGKVNDTFLKDTEKDRLVYFSQQTQVQLDCPDRNVRDNLFGLHKFPLACDVRTEDTYWPARQSINIEIERLNDSSYVPFDTSYLPVISLNETKDVHSSLKELINKLPDENDRLTIDFDSYGLTWEETQSYTIYSQTLLGVFTTINSIICGFLLIKWFYRKKQTDFQDWPDKFQNIRNSIKRRKNRLSKARSSLRDSFSSRRSSLKNRFYPMTPLAPSKQHQEASTNTETSKVKVYPPLPRYH